MREPLRVTQPSSQLTAEECTLLGVKWPAAADRRWRKKGAPSWFVLRESENRSERGFFIHCSKFYAMEGEGRGGQDRSLHPARRVEAPLQEICANLDDGRMDERPAYIQGHLVGLLKGRLCRL